MPFTVKAPYDLTQLIASSSEDEVSIPQHPLSHPPSPPSSSSQASRTRSLHYSSSSFRKRKRDFEVTGFSTRNDADLTLSPTSVRPSPSPLPLAGGPPGRSSSSARPGHEWRSSLKHAGQSPRLLPSPEDSPESIKPQRVQLVAASLTPGRRASRTVLSSTPKNASSIVMHATGGQQARSPGLISTIGPEFLPRLDGPLQASSKGKGRAGPPSEVDSADEYIGPARDIAKSEQKRLSANSRKQSVPTASFRNDATIPANHTSDSAGQPAETASLPRKQLLHDRRIASPPPLPVGLVPRWACLTAAVQPALLTSDERERLEADLAAFEAPVVPSRSRDGVSEAPSHISESKNKKTPAGGRHVVTLIPGSKKKKGPRNKRSRSDSASGGGDYTESSDDSSAISLDGIPIQDRSESERKERLVSRMCQNIGRDKTGRPMKVGVRREISRMDSIEGSLPFVVGDTYSRSLSTLQNSSAVQQRLRQGAKPQYSRRIGADYNARRLNAFELVKKEFGNASAKK